jgi:hypothetical protein
MQFLPGTFSAWAVDGDTDGALDPHDIDDAVATAAAYLCGTAGGLADERAALLRYNASDVYAAEVLGWAGRYATAPAPLAVTSPEEIDAILSDPNIVIYAAGRDDIAGGQVDARVLQVLVSIAAAHTVSVSSLVTGHPRCAVTGQADGPDCDVSNHFLGRAADIASIDSVPVSARSPVAVQLMRQLAALPDGLRPDEIGGPVDTGEPGVFTDGYHADHLHFGYDS